MSSAGVADGNVVEVCLVPLHVPSVSASLVSRRRPGICADAQQLVLQATRGHAPLAQTSNLGTLDLHLFTARAQASAMRGWPRVH